MIPARLVRLFAAAIPLALVLAACTDSDGGTVLSTIPPATVPSSPAAPSTTATTAPVPPGTAAATTTTTTTLAPGVDPEVAAALRAQIDELITVTEEIRGLSFIEEPNLEIVGVDELARRVREQIAEEEADIEVSDRLFTLLGVIEPDLDLLDLITELLAEQVLGYYDGDTKELVVASASDELSPVDKLTVVHELIHALTDQHFLFHEKSEAYEDAQQFDELSALIALVEGDATYFEVVYFTERFTFAEQLAVAESLASLDTAVFDASPEFLQADLGFPYETGYRFVEELVDAGGIRAVDDAYLTPPISTEQIIHPDRYFDAHPVVEVEVAEPVLAGYELYEEASFGEWGLELFFIDGDGRGLAEQIGDGWAGDEYRLFTAGEEILLIWEYQADREQDALELAEALIRLAEVRMGLGEGVELEGGLVFVTEEAYAFVDRMDDELVFVAASDPAAGAEAQLAVSGN